MNRTLKMLLLPACVLFCAAPGFAGSVICLKEAAVVAGGYVRLGEIAELRGDDTASLGRVFLGPAPEGEQSATVSRRDILQRLRGLGLDNGITFEGGEAVTVTAGAAGVAETAAVLAEPDARPVARAARKDAALPAQAADLDGFVDDLTAQPAGAAKAPAESRRPAVAEAKPEAGDPLAGLPAAGAAKSAKAGAAPAATRTAEGQPITWRAGAKNQPEAGVEAVRILIDQAAKAYIARALNTDDAEVATVITRFQVGAQPAAIEIEAIRNGELPGRAETALLLKDAEGRLLGYGTAELTVTAMVTAPLLVRNLKADETVMRGDIELRKVRFKPGMPSGGARPEEFLGRTAGRQLRAGSVVCLGDFSAGLDVRKGQAVQVTTILDGIRVGDVTMALSDGRRGDLIAVESVNGKTSYKARVTGPGTAEVPLAAGMGMRMDQDANLRQTKRAR